MTSAKQRLQMEAQDSAKKLNEMKLSLSTPVLTRTSSLPSLMSCAALLTMRAESKWRIK